MKYIEIKYKGNGAPRSQPIDMGGFMLEAPHKFDDGIEVIRKGQLGLQFKLQIPTNGVCKVPDTEHNREVLRTHCFPRTDIISGAKVKQPATYELLSDIDLNEDAPDKPEKTYTQKELEAIVAKSIQEAQAKKALTPAQQKKAAAELKKKEEAAEADRKRIEAEDAEEARRLAVLENETAEERKERIHKERFAHKIG